MIEIDCSEGESGGQIVRTALSLSSITQKPIRLFNIRAKRPNPGLAAQHLMCARSVRKICRGTLEHDEIGSSDLIFNPGKIVGGEYEFNIGTAGSVTLVAQTVIPILLYADKPSKIKIIGGTHVMKSPGYDYFEKVFIPAINLIGAKAASKLIMPGFYPKGGGEIEFEVSPSKLHSRIEWPKTDEVKSLIRLSGLPASIGVREKIIFHNNKLPSVRVYEDDAESIGNAITSWRGLCGSYVLGEKGKRAEVVAQEAIDELKKETECGADVDKHLADQILLYLCLADRKSTFSTSEITSHFTTNCQTIGRFLERKIKVLENVVSIS
ncbi:MAG: RNA 3'-terminal phosphate cyclase [Candidatus Micrarchaeota archaeon]